VSHRERGNDSESREIHVQISLKKSPATYSSERQEIKGIYSVFIGMTEYDKFRRYKKCPLYSNHSEHVRK